VPFQKPSLDMRGVKSLCVRVMDRLRASPTTTGGKELESLHRMPPCEKCDKWAKTLIDNGVIEQK
jgi:hypothetical protein